MGLMDKIQKYRTERKAKKLENQGNYIDAFRKYVSLEDYTSAEQVYEKMKSEHIDNSPIYKDGTLALLFCATGKEETLMKEEDDIIPARIMHLREDYTYSGGDVSAKEYLSRKFWEHPERFTINQLRHANLTDKNILRLLDHADLRSKSPKTLEDTALKYKELDANGKARKIADELYKLKQGDSAMNIYKALGDKNGILKSKIFSLEDLCAQKTSEKSWNRGFKRFISNTIVGATIGYALGMMAVQFVYEAYQISVEPAELTQILIPSILIGALYGIPLSLPGDKYKESKPEQKIQKKLEELCESREKAWVASRG